MHVVDKRSAHARAAAIVPSWVQTTGVPLWITDASGSICYLNPRAEALFGHSLDEWSGLSCHLAVAGRTRTGPFCCPRCRVRAQAAARREIKPVRVEITAKGGTPIEVCLVVITVESPAGVQLVHLVVDDDRERRIRGYLDRVVSRTLARAGAERPSRRTGPLSPREREVLSLLASDANLYEIAERLAVSHATVRNHVQHILSKLGVHSILEAVVASLIEDER